MYSLTLQPTPDEKDLLIAELWDAGTSGITESDLSLIAFFDDTVSRNSIVERFSDFRVLIADQEERNWVKETEDQWQPFAVGDRFYLVPEWRDDPAPAGRLRLQIHPGMAAGTGTHPATQLCLQALERLLEQGQTLMDAGTGSGILAEAAHLLSARRIAGCDIDPEAAAIAHRNLKGVDPPIAIFAGSLRSVRDATFDVVVANLNAATLRESKKDLLRVVNPGGKLIVAGFRVDEVSGVHRMLGVEKITQIDQDGWACLVLNPSIAAILPEEPDSSLKKGYSHGKHHGGHDHGQQGGHHG